MSHHQSACCHCGKMVATDASACRHCGSRFDDEWSEDCFGDDDVDEDFDYDEFVRENLESGVTNTQTPLVWRIVAVLLLIAFVLGYLWV